MNSNATNRTQYFGFPLFTGDDKPSILTDWNGTVEELDTTLEDIRVRLAGVEQTATAFMDTVNSLRERMDEIVTRIGADESIITENTEAITDLYDKLATLDTSVKSILTRLPELVTKTELTTAVGTINQNISAVAGDLAALTTVVNGFTDSIAKNASDLDDLSKNTFPNWNSNITYKQGDCVRIFDTDTNKYLYFRTSNEVTGVSPLDDTTHEHWRQSTGIGTELGNMRSLEKTIVYALSQGQSFSDMSKKGFYSNNDGQSTGFRAFSDLPNKTFNETLEALITDSRYGKHNAHISNLTVRYNNDYVYTVISGDEINGNYFSNLHCPIDVDNSQDPSLDGGDIIPYHMANIPVRIRIVKRSTSEDVQISSKKCRVERVYIEIVESGGSTGNKDMITLNLDYIVPTEYCNSDYNFYIELPRTRIDGNPYPTQKGVYFKFDPLFDMYSI